MATKKETDSFPLQYIKGIGPQRAKALAEEGITTIRDLCFYFPRDYVHREQMATLRAVAVRMLQERSEFQGLESKNFVSRTEVTVVARVERKREHHFGKNRRMLIVSLRDTSGGQGEIIFWNYIDFYNNSIKENELLTISGLPELGQGMSVKFNHPEIEHFDPDEEEEFSSGAILPVYPLTQKMRTFKFTTRQLRAALVSALNKELPEIEETLSDEVLQRENLLGLHDTIRNLHFPESAEMIERARERMKFEEIFFFETFLALRKAGIKTVESAPVLDPKSPRARKLYDALPFELTAGQKRTLREVGQDFKSGKPMNRLLQGDVGSGKTIVAVLSMLMAIDNRCQAAMVAPTELLAEQHFISIKNLTAGLDVNVVQLVGGQKTRVRNQALEEIRTGKADIIVGTHAMFESSVEYNRLAMLVIDEQHRFGVAQRAGLKSLAAASFGASGGISPHVLVMSATPIPRTLSLTLYGDLDVSIIREMPKNRLPINTRVVFESKISSTFDFIRDEIRAGRQAFIVYPLVEKSDKMDLKSAVEHFEVMKDSVFPEFRVGLLHGQMFWYEKDETMRDFLNKKFDILVATTVIEVGIDIPNASVMLIENAERFGLSQLHQLRGRVGRGPYQSWCFLSTKDHYEYSIGKRQLGGEIDAKSAVIRLRAMEETSDGFKIAETDLELRGPGDVLGTKQSGMPNFKFVNLVTDGDMIARARKCAFGLIDSDPRMQNPSNRKIRREFLRQFRTDTNFFDIA